MAIITLKRNRKRLMYLLQGCTIYRYSVKYYFKPRNTRLEYALADLYRNKEARACYDEDENTITITINKERYYKAYLIRGIHSNRWKDQEHTPYK